MNLRLSCKLKHVVSPACVKIDMCVGVCVKVCRKLPHLFPFNFLHHHHHYCSLSLSSSLSFSRTVWEVFQRHKTVTPITFAEHDIGATPPVCWLTAMDIFFSAVGLNNSGVAGSDYSGGGDRDGRCH